jgi:uncharacterized OB-fold protein
VVVYPILELLCVWCGSVSYPGAVVCVVCGSVSYPRAAVLHFVNVTTV